MHTAETQGDYILWEGKESLREGLPQVENANGEKTQMLSLSNDSHLRNTAG